MEEVLAASGHTPWYQHELWDGDPNDLRHKYPNWIKMEDLVYNIPGLKAIRRSLLQSASPAT